MENFVDARLRSGAQSSQCHDGEEPQVQVCVLRPAGTMHNLGDRSIQKMLPGMPSPWGFAVLDHGKAPKNSQQEEISPAVQSKLFKLI